MSDELLNEIEAIKKFMKEQEKKLRRKHAMEARNYEKSKRKQCDNKNK